MTWERTKAWERTKVCKRSGGLRRNIRQYRGKGAPAHDTCVTFAAVDMPARTRPSLSDNRRLENVCQPDPAKQFRPSAIGDCVDDSSPIIVRTEMNP
jgi:hypothetical protein